MKIEFGESSELDGISTVLSVSQLAELFDVHRIYNAPFLDDIDLYSQSRNDVNNPYFLSLAWHT
jgi:hypothetical protein